MKRPLGWVATLFGGGIVLGNMFQPPWFVLCLLGLVCCFICLAVSGAARPWCLGLLILLAGWCDLVCHTAAISPCDLRVLFGENPAILAVRGTLMDSPRARRFVQKERESWRTQATLRVAAVRRVESWDKAYGQVVVSTRGLLPEEFSSGQVVEVSGVLAPPPGPAAEGLFDYRSFLRQQGVHYQLQSDSSNEWRHVTPPVGRAPTVSDQFRTWARRALAMGLPGEDEPLRLEWALSLGDKSALTEEASEPFIRAATYHIFAVDGLRMAILFGIFHTLFRAMRVPRAVSSMALIPLIWAYTALTDWPASAIRASTMLTLVAAGGILKRPGDLINSLCAAALAIMIIDPQQLFQAGFQLSFTVVFCMVLTLPAIDRWSKRLLEGDPLVLPERRPWWRRKSAVPVRYTMDLLMTSLAAWLGSIPLVAYYFHIVTPVSTPANLVAVPLCSLVLASNFASLLTAGWIPGVAVLFNHAGWFLMKCISGTSDWFAGWPCAYAYVTAPGWLGIGLYYALLIGTFTGWLFAPAWRAGKLALLFVLVSTWCFLWWREESESRLFIIPLNGGSAIYVDAPGGGEDLLIDCGNTQSVDRVLKPFLRAHGVNRLPLLLLTHGATRQNGGAAKLRELLPVDRIATSPAPSRSPVYRQLLRDLRAAQADRVIIARGSRLHGWTVLHPESEDRYAQGDDAAVVLCRELDGRRILLLSDLGASGQEALLNRLPALRADVVVAGLPDQSEPLCDALLDIVQPELVVIADSAFPATRRAKAVLRERLKRRGCRILFTAEAGSVTVRLRKGVWKVSCAGGTLDDTDRQ